MASHHTFKFKERIQLDTNYLQLLKGIFAVY